MPPTPKDLDRVFVREVLGQVRSIREVGPRVAAISAKFLNLPYLEHPLIGSLETAEVFTASLAGFDCVTYVESVLALARAATPREFVDNLRRIRYADGVVDWRKCNHYMTSWIRHNRRAGIVRDRTGGPGLVEQHRRLSAVEDLPARTVRVRSVRKRDFLRRAGEVRSGDLAFFASTRGNLDVFHCGILARGNDGIIMRHAARSRGCVVEQDLGEFLDANRMAGVILVRPEQSFEKVA